MGNIHREPPQPGEVATPIDVRQYNKRVQREGRIHRDRFDQERLRKANALPYEDWLVPNSGLTACGTFKFDYTTKIPLGWPVCGNNAYVVNPRRTAGCGCPSKN